MEEEKEDEADMIIEDGVLDSTVVCVEGVVSVVELVNVSICVAVEI